MPPWRTSSPRANVLLAAAMTLLVVALPAVPASAVAPPYTMEERAAAIASPALVFIEARTEGYLRSKATGDLLDDDSFTMVLRCSGFGVSAAGHVITTSSCVQPSDSSLHRWAVRWFADRLISDGQLVKEQKDAYVDGLMGTSVLTVSDGGDSPETKLFGQVFRAWGGLTESPAFGGRIVESDPADNTALIKFEYENMPVVEIALDQLGIGSSVVLIGFGTSDSSTSTAAYTARTRPVMVTGRVKDKTPPRFALDGEIGDHSHGGMVVDAGGRVVGVINDDPDKGGRVNRAAASMAPVNDLLVAAGVSNTLTPRDQVYRAGLDAYFAGRYSEAIGHFDTVIAAVPDHTVAAEYRRHAAERLAIEGEAGGGGPHWTLVVIIVLTIIIAILLVMLIVVLVRRRPVQNQVPAMPYDWPVSAIPISATPISGVGYGEHTVAPHQHQWQQAGDPLALPSGTAPPSYPTQAAAAPPVEPFSFPADPAGATGPSGPGSHDPGGGGEPKTYGTGSPPG